MQASGVLARCHWRILRGLAMEEQELDIIDYLNGWASLTSHSSARISSISIGGDRTSQGMLIAWTTGKYSALMHMNGTDRVDCALRFGGRQ